MLDLPLILIDTCVLLEDPDVINRVRARNGLPFLTSTVLDEIDFNKTSKNGHHNNASVNRNARYILREFNKGSAKQLNSMPTGMALRQSDILTSFEFGGGPIFLIARERFRSRSNNDEKIIELAKDYGMVLITRDAGMKVRAAALGVQSVFWTGPEQRNKKQSAQRRTNTNGRVSNDVQPKLGGLTKPFALPLSPIAEKDTPLAIRCIPVSGDTVKTGSGHELRLGKKLSAGGEGVIYETNYAGQVCKIYHPNKITALKRRKIELMVSREITRPGICWPKEIVTTPAGEFVGYFMPKAAGRTMQSSMFVKPVLEKTFPQWTRRDLVNLCLVFIGHIRYLHSLNIIVGDINPLNLLVTDDSNKLWMVDTDSFQIENFPCPVGTVNFTAPENQGKNHGDFLRTKDHELFAVATMIFMILHPGKAPYSQQGGGSPMDNIKAMNFPYRFKTNESEFSGDNAPQGSWQFIWASLPYRVREAFHNTFRENRRTNIEQWADVLLQYRDMVAKGWATDELFPLGFKIRDPIATKCSKCDLTFTASKLWVDKLVAEGKETWCPNCAHRVRLERMARKSSQEAQRSGRSGAGGNQEAGISYGHSSPGQAKGGSGSSSPNWTASGGPASRKGGNAGAPSSQGGGGILAFLLKTLFK